VSQFLAVLLMLATLGFFGWIGWQAGRERQIDHDYYLSARGTQPWQVIGLSLFASGMGIWLLFGPSEVGYYGGFWEVLCYALSASTPFLLLAYIGPNIREGLPEGVTLADYVRMRIGRPMQVYVGLISVLYMFTFLFAEFTAIGKAMQILTNMEPLYPILLVALVTAAYTTYGGLPASLQTDRWQGWMALWLLIALLLIVLGADMGTMIDQAKAHTPEDLKEGWVHGSITDLNIASFEAGLALIIAITSAEMFSQGNWQRTYASQDNRALKKGALLAAALVFPLMFIMGFLGTVVAGQGAVADPSSTFFYLIEDAHMLIIALFIVLGIALVCSSADTLQNAVVASISRDLTDGRMNLAKARVVSLALIPLAVYLALWGVENGYSIFAIFLFADLLATATVLPVLLTLWDRIDSHAALAGAICGLLSVIAYGIYEPATSYDGIEQYMRYLIYPTTGALSPVDGGLTNLWVFLSALVGSGVVTVGGSLALGSDD
jgi:Na+/proline symporter